MDEPPEDDATSRRRRRALIVFFAFVLMTAVGIGSLILLLRDSEDVELARETGLDAPSDGGTLTPTAAVSITSASASTPPSSSSASPTSSAAFDAADLVNGGDDFGFGSVVGVQVDQIASTDDGEGTGTGTDGGGGDDGSTGTSTATSGNTSTGSRSTTTSSATTGTPFTMSVAVRKALYPGVSVPLNVSFANPNTDAITLDVLRVEIDDDGRSDCPMDVNFEVVQLVGDPDRVVVPGGGFTSLEDLGIADAEWPQLRMLAREANQNDCMGVSVDLTLSATATGGTS